MGVNSLSQTKLDIEANTPQSPITVQTLLVIKNEDILKSLTFEEGQINITQRCTPLKQRLHIISNHLCHPSTKCEAAHDKEIYLVRAVAHRFCLVL